MIRRVGGGRIDGRMDGLMQRQWLDFEWIDGWVAGWLDEGQVVGQWEDQSVNIGQMGKWVGGWVLGQFDGWVHGWMGFMLLGGAIDRQINELVDSWVLGQMDRELETCLTL